MLTLHPLDLLSHIDAWLHLLIDFPTMNCFAAVAKWLLDINGILKCDKCSDDENSDTIIVF